jgi:hypothetical protein
MKVMTELASKYVEKLEGVRPITSCHVVVDLPHRNRTKGRTFRVRVVCSVPGRKVVTAAASHTVPQVALADAFHRARRTVLDGIRRRARSRSARGRIRSRGKEVSGPLGPDTPEMVYNIKER